MSDEIIGFIVERIADLVAQEVNLLRGAENEFLSLRRELEMMQSFLIDADAKLEAGDQRLRTIVTQIREMANEAEDLIDSFLQKEVDRKEKAKVSFLKRMISFCSCIVQTHQKGSEVEELKGRIRETIERLQTYHVRTDVEVIRRERPKSYPHSVGDENVVGFDNDVEILVEKLINLDDQILALVGMGGSGKTTMARKIYNHSKVGLHFERRAWVSVSQIWNQQHLLNEIFRQLTGQTGETLSVETIVQEIHSLLHGKAYLVVLDDVWEQDVLRKIMVPVAASNGSKFLITTRIKEVVRFHDLGYYLHVPRRLNPEQSWDLFQKIAFGRQSNTMMDDEREPYVALGKEMLKKCDGLPLAVISLAGLLGTKSNIHEWKMVKSNVSSKIIGDKVGPSEYGRVEDMLALSYSDLNHTLKSCFMYVGLFLEDENISTSVLMQCWIAEGFFKTVQFEANESLEDVAKQHLDELIQRCLVQVVRVNYAEIAKVIRVHDLMRDVAIRRGKEICFLDTIPSTSLTHGPSSTPSGMQPRRLGVIAEKAVDIFEGDQQLHRGSRRLRSFVCSFENPWPERSLKNLFTNFPMLRVLILKCGLEVEMPDEIGNLIHLRHLQILYSTYIVHLPNSIKNLRNLLSFEFGDREYRPSWDGPWPNISQMIQLRYLRLPLGAIHVISEEPLILQDLRNLKVLWDISGGAWMLKEVKQSSTSIEKLGIVQIGKSEHLDMMYECPSIVQDCLYCLKLSFFKGEFQVSKLQHCNKLQKLVLDGVISSTKSSVPLTFPPFLVKLQLRRSRIKDHDSFLDALVRLSHLKLLYLEGDSYVGSYLNFPENSMPCLKELGLYFLGNLEEINVKDGAMPNLMALHIRSCPGLKVIPQRLHCVVDDKRMV